MTRNPALYCAVASVLLLAETASAQQAIEGLSARAPVPASSATFHLGDARKLFLSTLPPRPVRALTLAPTAGTPRRRQVSQAARPWLGGLQAVAVGPAEPASSATLDVGTLSAQTEADAPLPADSPEEFDFSAGGLDSEDLSDEDLQAIFEEPEGSEDDDPLEPLNRVIFDANLLLDRWLLRPVTRIYIETVPEPGREGLANMLDNAASPITLVNDLLQGEISRAGTTFGRFFINTLFGLGGFFDTADGFGLPGHSEDFGQTLATYGIGGSPYLVLPVLGPSSPRDAVGRAADLAFDPISLFAPSGVRSGKAAVGLISDRARIINETDALEATTVDFYAAIRSFYYQKRAFEIGNGRPQARSGGDGGEAAVE